MSPFKKAAVKGGGSKGKEPVIDVDEPSPRLKRTRSLLGVYDPNKFRSYATFQTHENYFRDATLLDWKYLLSNLDDAYENLVKEFYANVIIEGEELKCWVRGKSFSVTSTYLSEILHINQPIFPNPPVYDNLNPEEDLLQDALGRNLEFSQKGNSVSVSSLSYKLWVLTIIMFHNLYPLSITGYMNLGRALLLYDLITVEEIDICAHIFHILCKTVARNESRNCIPFCRLISRILKLKGVHPSEDESPYPRPSPINIRTLNASIGHSRRGIKTEIPDTHSGSRSSSSSCD
ncbi:hypothetical protein SO802_001070 [Lithocarpus litseifolius]|uniref:Putative plant transposon protein domain-containing protein n=1 Tax=Lithocarpus litseifolius TaxID=425828 RepID=A0AAW2DZ19_9ROSI